MPLFKRRRWEPPEPDCSFVVVCAAALPAVLSVAHPDAADGALPGFPILRGDESAPGELTELGRPMRLGETYAVATHERGLWGLTVRPKTPERYPERDIWPFIGLTDEGGAPLLEAGVEVLVERADAEAPVPSDILYGTRLADRVAALARGVVLDNAAHRAFEPGSWRIPEPVGDVDVREHAVVHSVGDDDGLWLHTHGLGKFGLPELEIFSVPGELVDAGGHWLNALGQYTIDGALIEPGHTIGDPERPVRAVEGGSDREHWGDVVVLELVDDGERHGVERGLREWAASQSG